MVSLSLFWPDFLSIERSFSVSQSIRVPGIEQDTNFPWASCHTEEGMLTDPHVAEREGGRKHGVEKRRAREKEREKCGHARAAMISLIIKSHECWGLPGKSRDQSHGFSKHLLVLAAMPQQSVYAERELAQALSTQQRGLAPEKAGGGFRPALTISPLEPYTISEMRKGSSVFTQQVWHKKTLLRPTETSLVFA